MANNVQERVEGEGGRKYLKWARSKHLALEALREDLNLPSLTKHFKLPDADISIRAAAMDSWIRIAGADPGGFIVQPYIRRISTGLVITLPDTHKVLRIPYVRGGKLKAFPGYGGFSITPQVDGKHIITGASGIGVGFGVFQDSVFSNSLTGAGDTGVFRHYYTDANGDAQSILLSTETAASAFQFKEAVSGAFISESGGAGATNTTYTVNARGTHVVYETNGERKSVALNYAGTPQAVKTLITDTTPYGEFVTTEHDVQVLIPNPTQAGAADAQWPYSNTHSGTRDVNINRVGTLTFPVTRGASASGDVSTVTLALTRSDIYTSHAEYERIYDEHVGDPTLDSYTYDSSGAASSSTSTTAVLSLPNGNSKEFFVSFDNTGAERISSSATQAVTTFHRFNSFPFDGTELIIESTTVFTATFNIGKLNIIYCDPTVPCVVYEYLFQSGEQRFDEGLQAYVATRGAKTREVGMLIGMSSHILFTDTSSVPVSPGGVDPWLPVDVGLTIGVDEFSFDDTNVDTEQINTNWYIKKLKVVHTTSPAYTTGYLGAKYQVDVRNEKNWVVGVTKLLDMDSNAISTYDIYFGRGGNAVLEGKFADYISDALAGDPTADPPVAPTDAVAAADLLAGNTSLYEIRLHDISAATPTGTREVGSFI